MGSKACDEDEALPEYRANSEYVLAALIYLMSRFPAKRSQAVAAAVTIHLRLIRDDPGLSKVIRDCADSLVDEWEAYEDLCAPDASIPSGRLPN